MHSKSDNEEMMLNDKEDEVIKPFQTLFSRYQIWLETSMKSSYFIFDCVYLIYLRRIV